MRSHDHVLLPWIFLVRAVSSIPASQSWPRDEGPPALQAINALQDTWYDPKNGLWGNLWWNSANCLTTIAAVQGSSLWNASFADQARGIYESSFRGGLALAESNMGKQSGSWLNNLYDDEGWWSLAWIKVYDVTGNQTYLAAAQDIYMDMKAGINKTPCGGLIWHRNAKLVNSIENSIFLDIAAKLATRVSNDNEDYLSSAMTQYRWLTGEIGLVTNKLVPDGIDPDSCKANEWFLTYNQGAILGGLVALYEASNHDEAYLKLAIDIASAAIDRFAKVHNGILTEDCDPNCDTTAAQFKGVFIRNLAILQQARPQDGFRDFIYRNADSIWTNARGDGNKLGTAWAGPYREGPVSAMCSGLDGLAAAATIDKTGGGGGR